MLSKAEIQYLQGQKPVSKSYEYKLKSIIKKKISNLIAKELPLLSSLFPNLDLTKIGKNDYNLHTNLTEISKNKQDSLSQEPYKAPGPGFEPGSRE